VPLGIFVLWCLVSCLWSPLPAFSVGEALTLVTLFLLAVALALVWRTSGDTLAVLGQLSVAFLLICAGLLAVYAVNPELSGLARSSDRLGAVGLLHPTKVGATASLGLVLVVACRLIWNWRWTRVLLLPSLVVFPIVLLLAASRMALGLTIVLTGLMVCTWGHRRWLATLLLVVSLGGIMYPLADPELEAARRAVGASTDLALRGESVDELRTLTGRTELWAALHKSFLQAPFVGHGYFVTSGTGELEVWSRSTNILAHNLLLQVAVSTGLVGLTLFLVGLWRPVAAGCRRLGFTSEGRRLRTAAAVLGAWYLGWGLLSESFMGALSPEAVLAFSLFGLVAGARGPEAQ